MRFLCCGLMSPPPERPCDDVGGLNSVWLSGVGAAEHPSHGVGSEKGIDIVVRRIELIEEPVDPRFRVYSIPGRCDVGLSQSGDEAPRSACLRRQFLFPGSAGGSAVAWIAVVKVARRCANHASAAAALSINL